MYTAEPAHIVDRHGLLVHQYTDDLYRYDVSTTVDDSAIAVDRLTLCLVYV